MNDHGDADEVVSADGPVGLAGAVEAALTLALLRRAQWHHPDHVVVCRRGDDCFLADGGVAAAEQAGVTLSWSGSGLARFKAAELTDVVRRLTAAGLSVTLFDAET